MELLQEIESYWSTRTEGYSEVNQKELQGMQKQAWLQVLKEHFPLGKKEELKILDIGCGPGFFTKILAEDGYCVYAVDYTPGMLEKARENLGELGRMVSFARMDAQNLEFESNQFDVIITRNLTWNLEEPAKAYAEWCRVLRPGGKLLNFDANWYRYLYDDEKREAYENDRKNVENTDMDDHYTCTDIDRMEKIALQMPLSAIGRPDWDRRVLKSVGFSSVFVDETIWQRVWSEEEKLNYASTPMFMIEAVKRKSQGQQETEADEKKQRVTAYWTQRSDSFLEQRREELHSAIAQRWMEEIHGYLPQKERLKILDIGCGTGFFSILLAKEGHELTGIDLTPEMVAHAQRLAQEENVNCMFKVMDAEYPEFADETFDVVISRNLTWTLPHADLAYEQWLRVLKKGGILLNVDADYGKDNFADVSALPQNHAHRQVEEKLMQECEDIKQSMPISYLRRPQWDEQALRYAGVEKITIDTGISRRLYLERDAFFNPTPLFLICAEKSVI